MSVAFRFGGGCRVKVATRNATVARYRALSLQPIHARPPRCTLTTSAVHYVPSQRDGSWREQILKAHRESERLDSQEERDLAWRQQVFSLYRSYLRQVSQLPHVYLRMFFQTKADDDFRALLSTQNDGKLPRLRARKLKRITKEVTRLDKANNGSGSRDAWDHILDLAYGRKGKLKREILKPYLTDPSQPLPDPIIPAVSASRPPVYSAALKALLTNDASRANSPLKPSTFNVPRNLPDTTSREARILNRGWRRRTVNAVWRHFTEEVSKTHFPLGSDVVEGASLESLGVLDDVFRIIGPTEHGRGRQLTRKQKDTLKREGKPVQEDQIERYSSRFVRRRYQSLMARIPQLTREKKGYVVSLPTPAKTHNDLSGKLLPEVDDVTAAWIVQARPSSAVA